MKSDSDFQPTMLGHEVIFMDAASEQIECKGMITDENKTEIYIESSYFTGWMSKEEYSSLLGTPGGEASTPDS